MSARPRRTAPPVCHLAVALWVLALVATHALPARAQPPAHHPGAWTEAQFWPGTETQTAPDGTPAPGVQAVHMLLARGDTLHGRPHSQVLAWGSWQPGRSQDGGLWLWNPTTDAGTAALGNLSKAGLATPPFNIFCGSHTSIPSASVDYLVFGGQDRVIAGVAKSVRFRTQERQWDETVASMQDRRWYGVGTAMRLPGEPENGRWGVLATAGIRFDQMTCFGGRNLASGTVTRDLERYQLTMAGGWETPPVPAGQWPEAREYHTLAEQGAGPHYLFAGHADPDTLFYDVWQLMRKSAKADPAQQEYGWTKLTIDLATSPEPRWRHVAVVDRESYVDANGNKDASKSTMYVHGGETATGLSGELWKLWWKDTPPIGWKWSLVTNVPGPSPGARVGATAVWDEAGNRMIVFGGEGANGALADDQVYVLDNPATSPAWRVAPRLSGSGPSARALHAMAADANKRRRPDLADESANYRFHAVVFGGDTESGPGTTASREIWRLYVEPGVGGVYWQNWTPPSGLAPEPRTGASAVVYEGYPASVVVTGGLLASGADAGAWEIPLDLVGGNPPPWGQRPALSHALHGHTALREREPVTALRPELYDPATNTWQPWGPLKYQFSYHMMFLASDGMLYYPGPDFWGEEKTWRLDPAANSGQGAWSEPPIAGHGFGLAFDECATGVLYRPNRMLKVGDRANGTFRTRALPVSASLDLGESSLSWRLSPDTLALARQFHNVTVLPSGDVIVTGGTELTVDDDKNPANDNPRQRPEIWDAEHVEDQFRGRWYGGSLPETLASEPVPRGHHSSAVLLPDGRLLSGGGHDTDPPAQIRSVDIYSPPYLYRPSAQGGAPAFRPRLYGAQDHIGWGGTFKVACPDPVVAACLIRPGASTHTFNQDQRYVPLTVVTNPSQDGHQVTLQAPASANVAPPGNYLLFVLANDPESGKRVPSIARWVNVGAAQTSYATWDTLPPAATSSLEVVEWTPTSVRLRLTVPADAGIGSTGKPARYELRFRDTAAMPTLEEFFTHGTSVSGLPAPGAAGTSQDLIVTGLPSLPMGATRYYRLISRDNAGSDRNWSALSNEVYSPAGGCPFVDTQTASGWREENSILGRSLTGSLALDGYRLRHVPAPQAGRIHLRVRENEQELTTLDQLRLIAIDHLPGLRAYALGDEVALGTRVPAAHVSTQAGLDVTALLGGTGEGFLGRPGDTLYVDLGLHASPAGAFGVSSVNSEHTVIIDDGGGKGGGNPVLWRAPERLNASAVDAQILGSTGIRLETQDETGAWQLLSHRYPREHPDEAAYEPPGHGALRLVFVGEHRLRFLGRLERSAEPFAAHKLPLLAATHTRLGDVATAVDTTGNLTTALAAGDTLALQFGWSDVPEGSVRELLLLSRGVYTANLPARGEEVGAMPPAFAFHGARPNPFAGGTALRFALPQSAHVRLEVLDAQGRRVALLANDRLAAGEHALTWNGRTAAGAKAGPGVYFYRFEAGAHRAKGKLTLLP